MIKIFKKLETEFTVGKAAFIIGFLTLAAKLVAFFRDPLFSSRFGGEKIQTLDIYNSAFRIPDFISNLLILGTLSAAFIPIFLEEKNKSSKKAFEFSAEILNFVSISIILICLTVYVFIRPLSSYVVPGFFGEALEQTIKLTKLLLLSPIIFSISNIFTSFLHAEKKFIFPSIAPLFYNLGIILGVLFGYNKFGIIGLGYGVIFGAVMHLICQIPMAVSQGFIWRPVLPFKNPAFYKMLKLYFPRIFTLDIYNVSLLIVTYIGSGLALGSIAVFNFAANLYSVPIGIFGISYAIATFPSFSELYIKNDLKNFSNILYKTCFEILFFIIPISVLFLIYRAHFVRLYLGHGNFTWENTIYTFSLLGILSISMFSQSLTPIFTRAFYSMQNTTYPAIINILCIFINVMFAKILVSKHGLNGLAYSLTITSIVNALLLFFILRINILKKDIQLSPILKALEINLFKNILSILFSSILMGIAGYYSLRLFEPIFDNSKTLGLFLQTSFSATLAVITFIYTALLLKLKPAEKLTQLVKKFIIIVNGFFKF